MGVHSIALKAQPRISGGWRLGSTLIDDPITRSGGPTQPHSRTKTWHPTQHDRSGLQNIEQVTNSHTHTYIVPLLYSVLTMAMHVSMRIPTNLGIAHSRLARGQKRHDEVI